VSWLRVRVCLTAAAVLIWLAALAGRKVGLGRSAYSAADQVVGVLLAGVLGVLAGGLVWGWARRAVRRRAGRTAVTAQSARVGCGPTRSTAETLAWQTAAATGAVGCAAVLVCGGRAPTGPRPVFSAAGRSGRRGQPIGPGTRFEVGSLTKIFTGLLLADMAVRGEVELDMPLGAVLGGPAADGITLRSLATHTSGLPRRITMPRLGAVLTANPDPYGSAGLAQVTAALARRRPPAPGRFRYSNVGYQLLAASLVAVAGSTWPDLVQQRICGPLGLTATSLFRDQDTARGHDKAGLPIPYSDHTRLPGAFGLLSSTADLDRFVRAQLDPACTPLGPAIRLSRTVHTPPEAGRLAGLGWRLKTSGAASMAWHSGLAYGFSALLAVIDSPDDPRGLAILTNSPYLAGLSATGLNTLRIPCGSRGQPALFTAPLTEPRRR
jgi:D-alanyl-D-alanine-carboxypeptidase/D-alanyl-D-alanine-endopeptidase